MGGLSSIQKNLGFLEFFNFAKPPTLLLNIDGACAPIAFSVFLPVAKAVHVCQLGEKLRRRSIVAVTAFVIT